MKDYIIVNNNKYKIFKTLIYNNYGVTAIEYALIAGLVAVVIVFAVTSVGTSALALFQSVADAFPG